MKTKTIDTTICFAQTDIASESYAKEARKAALRRAIMREERRLAHQKAVRRANRRACFKAILATIAIVAVIILASMAGEPTVAHAATQDDYVIGSVQTYTDGDKLVKFSTDTKLVSREQVGKTTTVGMSKAELKKFGYCKQLQCTRPTRRVSTRKVISAVSGLSIRNDMQEISSRTIVRVTFVDVHVSYLKGKKYTSTWESKTDYRYNRYEKSPVSASSSAETDEAV